MGWKAWITQERMQRRTHALNGIIHALPLSTRQAMLAAAEAEHLIAGGYTDGGGGACPMLAAHRRGARDYCRGFPRAWDRFTGAARPRPATARELEILKALLQESIGPAASDQAPPAPAAPAARADRALTR